MLKKIYALSYMSLKIVDLLSKPQHPGANESVLCMDTFAFKRSNCVEPLIGYDWLNKAKFINVRYSARPVFITYLF